MPPSTSSTASCRNCVLLARAADRAVVLRRGPSKRVLLSTWNLNTDELVHGHWFKGRIYTERCGLSPRGDYLLYAAANHRGPTGAWTAICKPPSLKALVRIESGFVGGGGVFLDETRVLVNALGPIKVAAGAPTTPQFEIAPIYGYDGPKPMIRDGWVLVSPGKDCAQMRDRMWDALDPPELFARPNPRAPSLRLERRLLGRGEINGPLEVLEYDVRGAHESRLGRLDWADWSRTGDLLFSREGTLFRSRLVAKTAELTEPARVFDMRPLSWT